MVLMNLCAGQQWRCRQNRLTDTELGEGEDGTNGESSIESCVLSRFSCVRLFVTLWTVVYQAPPSMEVSGEEYWSALPCPPPGDLPDSGIKPESLMSPALAGRFVTTSATWEAPRKYSIN